MKAFLDGDMVCIVDDNFVNLQESNSIFVSPEEFHAFMKKGDCIVSEHDQELIREGRAMSDFDTRRGE